MRQLPVRDIHALIADAAPDSRPLLLDVREPWEFELAAIRLPQADTVLMPMGEVPARLAEIDPERTIVCVCHHGMRSLHVARFLAQQGCDDVINMQGGIDAWSREVDPGIPRY